MSPATLCWADLEPWMDDEYARQVCALMGWETTQITVPRSQPDPITGHHPNNPGYCYLTFPDVPHAAAVLAQIAAGPRGKTPMPNSSKHFNMSWAPSSLPQPPPPQHHPIPIPPSSSSIIQRKTSNSDLVAVFRNPVLGLRNDREPKFIRPFLSCKSAKIMLDPTTGVSRGYGFVRFTDEADQQRALIEMHGLYCLSRPMRISPATAKFKAPAALGQPALDLPHVHFTPPPSSLPHPVQHDIVAPTPTSASANPASLLPLALPASAPSSSTPQSKSVSAPIAASPPGSFPPSSSAGASIGNSLSNNSLASGASSSTGLSITKSVFSPEDTLLHQLAQQYNLVPGSASESAVNHPSGPSPPGNNNNPLSSSPLEDHLRALQQQQQPDRYILTEDAWKHHAQARAILGNLIGPNGEQLTSTDPYNTTVFVGGLSPLISEDTLRTFFAPFGEIHYVKVPVGKHCGFVQFVKKADAEKAIEKMQGFPIGGSRIRLSWGRSQYKAAQAAAQAAQAAALQASFNSAPPPAPGAITSEQAMQLLQRFNLQQYLGAAPAPPSGMVGPSPHDDPAHGMDVEDHHEREREERIRRQLQNPYLASLSAQQQQMFLAPSSSASSSQQQPQRSLFSPFSPDPASNALYNSSESGGAPLSLSSSSAPGSGSSASGSRTSPVNGRLSMMQKRDTSPFSSVSPSSASTSSGPPPPLPPQPTTPTQTSNSAASAAEARAQAHAQAQLQQQQHQGPARAYSPGGYFSLESGTPPPTNGSGSSTGPIGRPASLSFSQQQRPGSSMPPFLKPVPGSVPSSSSQTHHVSWNNPIQPPGKYTMNSNADDMFNAGIVGYGKGKVNGSAHPNANGNGPMHHNGKLVREEESEELGPWDVTGTLKSLDLDDGESKGHCRQEGMKM